MNQLKLILLISSFILPLSLAVSIFRQSDKNLPKRIMAIGLLNSAVVFLFNYFYFERAYPLYSYLHSVHIATMLWLFPSFHLYIKAIILDDKRIQRGWPHFLPGLVCGAISASLFWGWLDQDERIYYLINYRQGCELATWNLKSLYCLRMAVVAILTAQVAYYSYVLIMLPQCYKKRLQEEFSNIERFSLDWVKWFTLSFLLIATLCVLFYAFTPLAGQTDVALITFLFLFSTLIWWMGIFSLRQQKAQIASITSECDIPPPPSQTAIKDDELTVKLIEYIATRQAFLRSDITLTIASREIGTNRTYLSGLINQQFGMNFNTFINQYRAEYIYNYQIDHNRMTQDELAEIGGFGSVSSMKRALKRWKKWAETK